MRYVSIDLETGGLDARYNPILEVGLIIEDTEKCLPFSEIPKRRFLVAQADGHYCLQPYAAKLNVRLLDELSKGPAGNPSWILEDELLVEMKSWIYSHFRDTFEFNKPCMVTVAGKNFNGFDLPFFQQLLPTSLANPKAGIDWREHLPFHRRALDAGSNFAVPSDLVLPDTQTCMERAGLEIGDTHVAIDDAWDIIRLFRVHWGLKGDLKPSNSLR